MFILVVLQFWGWLITTGLVVENTVRPQGAQSLAEKSERGESICAAGWEGDDFLAMTIEPSKGNAWDRRKVISR